MHRARSDCHPFGGVRVYALPVALSFSRPDPSSPDSVAAATFAVGRRGYDQSDVRDFLRMVAAELARLQERERYLDRELRTVHRSAVNPAVALDEEVVTRLLGEEAARILQVAREASQQIRIRAEEGAARLLREATDEAQRLRQEAELESARRRSDAAADAEAELEMAKQQGREMVNEARAYRERVLGELARRREVARQQIEQLVHGRDRLLQAFERSRLVAIDVMAELTPLGEPEEYVNLSPVTGPVPVMLPASAFEAQPDPAAPTDEPMSDAAPVVLAVVGEVVQLPEPAPVDDHPSAPDDRKVAPVVALFAGELADSTTSLDLPPVGDEGFRADDEIVTVEAELTVVELVVVEPELVDDPAVETAADPATHVDDAQPPDDLFSRLRAARAASVAERAAAALDQTEAMPRPSADARTAAERPSVFRPSAAAPAVDDEPHEDTPFARRDETLTPIILTMARKVKRVLADEQNDVLDRLRRKEPVRSVDDLVATDVAHAERYTAAIAAELTAAAVAGAGSVDDGSARQHKADVAKAKAMQPAAEAFGREVVVPLRERLARAVSEADGDNAELSQMVRNLYREWKTQRIDEHLDDVARTAFGRGALAALEPGTPVCWIVDPAGPACPDAEDNALAGAVPAGTGFPTDHTCAPAHAGCRCMLVTAPR